MEISLASATPDVLATHARFVRALARQLLADDQAAEDVAQETWLRFARRPPREPAAARGWLRAVTTRLSIERLRSGARSAAREELAARPEALPSVEEELAQAEVLRSVAEAVLGLDDPYRTTVLLAYWRGWDARRIASETATPLATVRSRLQRAHVRLRERLDRVHGRETWALALARLPMSEVATLAGAGAWIAAAVVLGAGIFLWRPWSAEDGGARAEAVAVLAAPAEVRSDAPAEEGAAIGAREALADPSPIRLRIGGTVHDGADAELGLAGAPSAGLALRVRIARANRGGKPLAESETRTDGDGRFEVELELVPGTEELFAQVSAAADERYRGVHANAAAREASSFALVRVPHGTLHGTLRDPSGTPLADVALSIGGRAVTSADDGGFAIPYARERRPVELATPGLALLGWEEPRPLAEGGWEPMTVLVGPAAALELRVVDGAGRGIADVAVSVVLPPSELAVLAAGDPPARQARTGADGGALLTSLWAERKLRVSLTLPSEHRIADGMEAGRLLLAAPPGSGTPIVIAPGARLALEARVDVERDVAGRVTLPGGAGVPRAEVEVVDLGGGNAWSRPVLLALETDEGGRFAGRLRTAELVGPLRITAKARELAPDAAGGAVRGLGYGGPATAADVSSIDMPAAEVELAAGDAEALADVVLELGPRFAISGTLLGRDGAPVARIGWGGSRVWAAPEGSAYHGHGVVAAAVEGAPGRFELPGLAPGRYDLFVSEEHESFYSYENFLHRFAGIEAGASGVELRLPERRETRIVVRFAGEPPEQGIVLHRKLFPAPGFAGPTAERVTRVSGPRGWPAGATLGFTGIGGHVLAAGNTSDGYDSLAGAEHAFAPLEPGWYAIGVHAPGMFPQATDVLWFGEGEHVVEFEPLFAATLRGRVAGDAAGEFLALALVDASGTEVPLAQIDGFGEPATVLETSASGAFVLRHAPTGAFTLRVGTRAELERGEPRRALPLEILPGDNPPIDVRL